MPLKFGSKLSKRSFVKWRYFFLARRYEQTRSGLQSVLEARNAPPRPNPAEIILVAVEGLKGQQTHILGWV